jgi:lysophospholipase L1-like esterase
MKKLLGVLMLLFVTSAAAAWDTIPDRRFPAVLSVGDSISLHYLSELSTRLIGKYTVSHIAANARSSNYVRAHIDGVWTRGYTPDIILLNCGIHDLTLVNGMLQVSLYDYEINLRQIVTKVHNLSWHPKLIWVRTTPVSDTMQKYRLNSDVILYNATADRVMQELGVPIIDVYTPMAGNINKLTIDGVHPNEAGERIIAATITARIGEIMAQ